MEQSDILLSGVAQTESDKLHRVIGNTFIVDYGIIKKVVADGIVQVEMLVTNNAESVTIINCVLASFASNSVTFNIKPEEGDKVIVLFPKSFSGDMFRAETEEVIISESSKGYSILGGIAILLNQYQKDLHKNIIDFSKGKLTLKLAYSKDDDKNFVEFTTDDKGNIVLKNDVTTITMDKDGAYEIDNGKAKISIDKNGNVVIDAMDGKLTLKNNKASLFDIMDSTLNTLNTTYKTQGSPYTHTTIPNQLSTEKTQLGQLMQ